MEKIIRESLHSIRELCDSDFTSDHGEEGEVIENERKKMTRILLASVRVMLMSEDLACSAYDWYKLVNELHEAELKAKKRFNICKEEE